MFDYENKLNENLFNVIKDISNPIILELGVQSGISTKKFLKICDQNDGRLYSVDIEDCSGVANNYKWRFIQSRDDNFDYIRSIIPNKIDVLFIDTLHEAKHVENIFFYYYNLIKKDGYVFIDDISHLPYLKNKKKTDFYCAINNQETFNKILEIYSSNYTNFSLNFSFQSSGLAIIKKKTDDKLNLPIKIKSSKFFFKNILRKIWHKIKKK
jgi:predicted O-methyltransferase YrrM